MSDDSDIRVQLARMEGKMDVANERLETANRINDERHEAVKARLATVDLRLHGHSDRLGILEAARHVSDGERKGIQVSTKVIWTAGIALIGSLLTAAGLAMRFLA